MVNSPTHQPHRKHLWDRVANGVGLALLGIAQPPLALWDGYFLMLLSIVQGGVPKFI